MTTTSFHPSFTFFKHFLNSGSRGELGLISAVIGSEVSYTLDRSPVHHMANTES